MSIIEHLGEYMNDVETISTMKEMYETYTKYFKKEEAEKEENKEEEAEKEENKEEEAELLNLKDDDEFVTIFLRVYLVQTNIKFGIFNTICLEYDKIDKSKSNDIEEFYNNFKTDLDTVFAIKDEYKLPFKEKDSDKGKLGFCQYILIMNFMHLNYFKYENQDFFERDKITKPGSNFNNSKFTQQENLNIVEEIIFIKTILRVHNIAKQTDKKFDTLIKDMEKRIKKFTTLSNGLNLEEELLKKYFTFIDFTIIHLFISSLKEKVTQQTLKNKEKLLYVRYIHSDSDYPTQQFSNLRFSERELANENLNIYTHTEDFSIEFYKMYNFVFDNINEENQEIKLNTLITDFRDLKAIFKTLTDTLNLFSNINEKLIAIMIILNNPNTMQILDKKPVLNSMFTTKKKTIKKKICKT